MSPKLTCHQWTCVSIFCTVYGLLGFIYTLQAPFYPGEAKKKGASAVQYGSVSGVYAITITLVCPAIGYLISFGGSKNIYYMGIISIGTSTVLFGCLDQLQNLSFFLAGSIGLRIVEGIGFSATYVAMYSFVPTLFPDHVSLVTGILEMSNVIAFGIGPALGAYLFLLGGFPLPFIVVGALMLTSVIFVVPTIWNYRFADAAPAQGFHTFTLLKEFDISLNFLAIFLDAVTTSYLFTNLALYLETEFNMSPSYAGLVFCAFGIFTGFLSPLWGYCIDKVPNSPLYFIILGVVIKIAGSLLIGPVPLLDFQADMATTVTGVSIYAIGNGLVLIAAYVNAPVQARKHGFPNDGTTSALVFGCGIACYSLGSGIGAPISGLVFDYVGFRWGELFIFGVELFMLFILLGHICTRKCVTREKSRKDSERTALLNDKN